MQTPETFYRLHHTGAPAFTADNAWSAPWGSSFTDDGSSYTCVACDGTGEQTPEIHESCDGQGCHHCDDGMITECADCDGDGTLDCERGYSCTWDAAGLVAYFKQQHATPTDDMGTIYVFEGEWTGDGADGDPLAVPTKVIETLTWSELVARAESA
ncbi:hypothetical protein [Nocardiopsis lucentensis]|uniref:hypothetical protein n=1 Tax=Nocardiopsis lucentensis TaxID=53441 RepID=UPI0003451681|nr:hypothetical protein [Nocardiopsis lucentensis]